MKNEGGLMKMKKMVSLLLIIIILFMFTACTDQNAVSDSTDSVSVDSTASVSVDSTNYVSPESTTSAFVETTSYGEDGVVSGAPTLVLNGNTLDVYTSHYFAREEYAIIPLTAFLQSVGAEYADSPLNEYGRQCYSFMGNRYIFVGSMHLFMLENDYIDLLNTLAEDGVEPSKENTADKGLLPRDENAYFSEVSADGTLVEWGQIWIDHISLMNALRESGIDITIEYDYPTKTITVIMP